MKEGRQANSALVGPVDYLHSPPGFAQMPFRGEAWTRLGRTALRPARVQVRRVVHVAGACFVLLLICSPAFAQLNLGRTFGIISDTSGGAVVGATVTITNVARRVSGSYDLRWEL